MWAGLQVADPLIYAGNPFAFTVYDTSGVDTLDFSVFSMAQTINLNELTYSSVGGGTGNMTIARGVVIERATGGSDADFIVGNAAGNVLTGNNGNDTLNGSLGNDTLMGGIGADSLIGDTGTDTASYLGAGAAVRVDMLTQAANLGEAAGDILTQIEVVAGSTFNDTVSGDNLVNTLYGNSGNDALDGRGSSDYLFGGDGNDTLVGGAGGDYFDGGSSARDLASYWTATAGVRAVLLAPAGNSGDAAGDSYVGIEDIGGTGFSDVLGGDNAANQILGGNGNDDIDGFGGNDSIYGGEGNDRLIGTSGRPSGRRFGHV